MRDRWVEKYQNEVYERFKFPATDSECRPAGIMGVITCLRPVVRDGRCVLHAPKLMDCEKRLLTPENSDSERQFEDNFRASLLQEIREALAKCAGSVRLQSIQFPGMPWNQPPWNDILQNNHVDFSMSVFHQEANLSGVGFSHQPHFTKTVFRDNASFNLSVFHDGVQFVDAVFERDVSFSGTRFGGRCNFAQSRFEGSVDFYWAKVLGRVWFKGSRDSQVFFGESRFQRLELEPGADISFESVSLTKASLLYTDIESLRLADVTWSQPESNIVSRLSRRKMLWDEKQVASQVADVHQFEAIADNYRQLVLNYERKRDYDSAEDFHIGEMEMRRLLTAASAPRALRRIARYLNAFALYRYLSTYGSSYLRAFGVLLVMLLLTSALLMFAGLRSVPTEPDERSHLIQYHVPLRAGEHLPSLNEVAMDYANAVTHTLSVMTYQRERAYRPARTLSRAVESLAAVVLASQAALFLLAVRRRFKR